MASVFLSHSQSDDDIAKQLTIWLAQQGITDVFTDHGEIRTGDRWGEALRNAKASCRIVLSIVSPGWLSSDECFGEFLAGWYAGKRMVSLLMLDGQELDVRQQQRLQRVLVEDQGFDLCAVGAPKALDLGRHPDRACLLIAGLKAGGAITRVGLDPNAFEVDVKARPEPFPGLDSFNDDDADAAIFFGRGPEIASCIEDIREMRASGDRRAYLILGASGSGKSSLMKAGILPRLRRERAWIVLRAFRPGADPLYNFADAIARTASDYGLAWAPGVVHEELLSAWRSAGTASDAGWPSGGNAAQRARNCARLLGPLMARIDALRLAAGRAEATCLVACDQGEELARGSGSSADALAQYLIALTVVAPREGAPTPFALVFTIRDDGLSELLASGRLTQISMRTVGIRTLPLYRFAQAIEQPAERYGIEVEPALVQALIEDAPETDSLPLLAFALRRLWSRFAVEGRVLKTHYDMIGKLSGLVEDASERALRGLHPRDDTSYTAVRPGSERDRRAARIFIPGLAQINEHGLASRRHAPAAIYCAEDVDSRGPGVRWGALTKRGGAIEVAHEALFREWPRFNEWLTPERARMEALRYLEQSAATWDLQGRKGDYIIHAGNRLAAAEALRSIPDYRRRIDLSPHVAPYLAACTGAERKRRLLTVGATSVVALSAALLLIANSQRIGSFVDTIVNVEAAFPQTPILSRVQRDQLQMRQELMSAVLEKYITVELGETVALDMNTAALLESRAGGTSKNDAWTMGQISAALDRGKVNNERLGAYLAATFKTECSCWSPIDGDQHAGATAWIAMGHVVQKVPLRASVLQSVLERQSPEGGWPIFFDAERSESVSSSYATALMVLALHGLLQSGNLDAATADAASKALLKGRIWLQNRAAPRGKWLDYPDSKGRTVASRGNTAFVVFTLLQTGSDEVDRRLFEEWFRNLPEWPTAFDTMDTSDQFVRLGNGAIRRDGTRYITFAWELATAVLGAQHLELLDRISARRFIQKSLDAWPRSETGKFDFLTAETLFAIDASLKGRKW